MALYKELIYIVADELKQVSDDTIITEDHIKFLLQKYRAFLIYQKYKDIKKEIPTSAYQTICLDLETVDALDGSPCTGGKYLRSVNKIPHLMTVGNPVVYPFSDYYQGDMINYVPRERMRFVGHNKYLRNIIYCSLSPNGHLYFKSINPQFLYLEKVTFTGIFEDPEEAIKLACESEGINCDIMENIFPIEESMIPMLIESVVKELAGANYRPEDAKNNASDDLSNLNIYLANNTKSALAKQLEG